MQLDTFVQATPSTVAPGASVILNVNVTASETRPLLFLLQIFDASLTKVHETTIDKVGVSAGVPKNVPFSWSVPASLPQGVYSVSLGVFGAEWSGMYQWYAGITTFAVSANPQIPNFASTAAVTPTRIAPGGAVTIDVALTSSVSVSARTEIALIRPDGIKVPVRSSGDAFEAATPKHLMAPWSAPAGAPIGTYLVEVGVYNADRTERYHFNASAGQLKVLPDTAPAAALKASVKTGTSLTTGQPSPSFEIYNTGEDPIDLKDIKVRYYFTIDEETTLAIDFWSTLSKAKVIATFAKMPVPSEQADHYLEIGFTDTAGVLSPGAKVGVHTWFNRSPWGAPFDQTNDYSFTNSNEFIDSPKTTGYVSGALTWGVEPPLLDRPPFPASIRANAADTSITLTWEPVAGAAGYDVEANGRVVAGLTDTSYLDPWLNPGTLHTYRVRTRKDGKVSVWSSPVSLKTTGEQVLPAPVNVRARPAEGSITLTWSELQESITGYDVEVDGAVVDVGMSTSYVHSGLGQRTQHRYRVRAKDGGTPGPWSGTVRVNTPYTPTGTFDVSFAVDTSAERAPISPYIYGTNSDLTGAERWTVRRMGGNRLSTYNWENNASNAGVDWHHTSDDYVPWFYGGIPMSESEKFDIPGIAATAYHERSLSMGAGTLLTLQTAGYVAKDKDGSVPETLAAPSSRWVEVKASKGAPFSLVPDPSDGAVFMDEFVNFLVNRFGDASTPTGIGAYSIDNEPGLWADSHPRMHREKATCAEVMTKSADLARAVKRVDPHAKIFGPASYGFSEYYDMQSAIDWGAVKSNYDWYIDYYLDNLRIESAKEGRRLLDVLDLHWYTEAVAGGQKILRAGNDNQEANKARVQAPRSLWDPSYWENSWVSDHFSSFLPLIPRLQRSIAKHNAGTKLAFSEYNYGGENHISGGIAMADVLGIFGKLGVYLGAFWKMGNDADGAPYVTAAFRLFNNYDGNGSRYGDTAVKAETSDIDNSSVYASVDEDGDGNLRLIVINKNFEHDMNAVVHLGGGAVYTSARVWAFDSSGPGITEKPAITSITNNSLMYTVPKLTVCHIVLTAGTPG
ncbi:glycoside hydrolase family 44 protein [Sorangium sp. So ce385]|uniref:glycoside hydrolase family 44 protein n=1 Tax=Sorangium sp. So ce385 TaxID=3133308 RepID=UPI003F5B351A